MPVDKLAGETTLSGVARWVQRRAAKWQACMPLTGRTLPCTYPYLFEQLDVACRNPLLATALLPEALEREWARSPARWWY